MFTQDVHFKSAILRERTHAEVLVLQTRNQLFIGKVTQIHQHGVEHLSKPVSYKLWTIYHANQHFNLGPRKHADQTRICSTASVYGKKNWNALDEPLRVSGLF